MTVAILLNTLKSGLKSHILVLGTVIITFLVAVTLFVNIEEFRLRQQDWLDASHELGKNEIVRKPQTLSILSIGMDSRLGVRARLFGSSIPSTASGYLKQSYADSLNKILTALSLDFNYIVRIIMSLMVIFIVYGTISGEKAQGTLKLILSNSVPRHTVLLGKCTGEMILILLPLVLSCLVAAVIIALHPAVSFAFEDWQGFAMIIGTSILYLVTVYMAGLVVSVLVDHPSVALIILLQLWMVAAVLYPAADVQIAGSSLTLPSQKELLAQRTAAGKPYWDRGNNSIDAFIEKYPGRNPNEIPDDPLLVEHVRAHLDGAIAEYRVERGYQNILTAQAERANTFAFLSPPMLLDAIITHIARTDLKEYELFLDGIFDYWKKYYPPVFGDARVEAIRASLPPFSYPGSSFAERVFQVMDKLLLLFLYSVFCFTVAFVGFLRKDVR